MPTRLLSAERHAAQQTEVARQTLRQVAALWALVGVGDLDGGWAGVGPQIVAAVTGGQYRAAALADGYVDDVTGEQGIDAPAVGAVDAGVFAASAADGRSLGTLLREPIITAKVGIGEGLPVGLARQRATDQLLMLTTTTLQDTGRAAVGAATVARPKLTGYVRMLTPPSCARCVILAGRVYRWSSGFQRHPRCFPAGVMVSGPEIEAATRRWYEGELVILRTAGGQELPATGNHPVLTDRGWLPANLVQEGDHVVRSLRPEGAGPLVVPDEHQVPARVEDLWRPDGVVALVRVPSTAEDFHGDGGYGQVDVVLADRLLRNRAQSAAQQAAVQEHLAGAVAQAAFLADLGSSLEQFQRVLRSPDGVMGGLGLREALLRGHAAGAHLPGIGHAADGHLCGHESLPDGLTGDPEALAEGVLALAREVGRGEFLDVDGQVSTRWDAPAAPFSMESRAGYASAGQDLLERLSGQVALDRVVELRRVQWSGHVYNLTSSEGWYSANGLIVSNCDCRHIPTAENVAGDLTTDPVAYVGSLGEAGRERLLGKASAQALSDGADLNQLVNARRGGLAVAGRAPRRGSAGRLTPERIYQAAGDDRGEAIRLLRLHGYIR